MFLGTGAGSPSLERNVQGAAVKLGDGRYVLVDCGEGTQQTLLRVAASRAPVTGDRGFRASKVACVCVTHLHGDHAFGLPGLVCYLDAAASDGAPPLRIVGPVGVAAMLRSALLLSRTELRNGYAVDEIDAAPLNVAGRGAAYEAAARAHACALPPAPHPDERPGRVVRRGDWGDVLGLSGGVAVSCAELDHGCVACVGYRIQEAPRVGAVDPRAVRAAAERAGDDPRRLFPLLRAAAASGVSAVALADGAALDVAACYPGGALLAGRGVAVLGDCAHGTGGNAAAAADLCRGADLVVHEATFADEHADLALARGHSTPGAAGAFARDAGAGALALWHFSPRYRSDPDFAAKFRAAAAAAFGGGDVTLAADELRLPVARTARPPAPPN